MKYRCPYVFLRWNAEQCHPTLQLWLSFAWEMGFPIADGGMSCTQLSPEPESRPVALSEGQDHGATFYSIGRDSGMGFTPQPTACLCPTRHAKRETFA